MQATARTRAPRKTYRQAGEYGRQVREAERLARSIKGGNAPVAFAVRVALLLAPSRLDRQIADELGCGRSYVTQQRGVLATALPDRDLSGGRSRRHRLEAGQQNAAATGANGKMAKARNRAVRLGWGGPGIRGRMADILEHLRLHGPAMLSQIVRPHGVLRTHFNRACRRLVALGYVRRQAGQWSPLELTETGRNCWQKPDTED